jgi:hypothetical protein
MVRRWSSNTYAASSSVLNPKFVKDKTVILSEAFFSGVEGPAVPDLNLSDEIRTRHARCEPLLSALSSAFRRQPFAFAMIKCC